MLNKIKKNIDQELSIFIKLLNQKHKLNKISPILYKSISNFLARKGKRIRPLLFIIGYKGFSNKNPRNLYRSALAMELLHAFLLIHDDILDNADTRRGKPAMHILINQCLNSKMRTQSTGMNLAVVIGDIIYALAIEAFMAIAESPAKKQTALLKFIESGFLTGCGEFVEIVNSKKDISRISKAAIYQIYAHKTAHYTFSAPLVTSAILAGANKHDLQKLAEYGKYCGQAFQIKDDILGIFSEEKQTGKSNFTDLQESKKTLLIWHAYKHSSTVDKLKLQNILRKNKINKHDIVLTRRIIQDSGSLSYCQNQIKKLLEKSIQSLKTTRLKNIYKQELINYCGQILKL